MSAGPERHRLCSLVTTLSLDVRVTEDGNFDPMGEVLTLAGSAAAAAYHLRHRSPTPGPSGACTPSCGAASRDPTLLPYRKRPRKGSLVEGESGVQRRPGGVGVTRGG